MSLESLRALCKNVIHYTSRWQHMPFFNGKLTLGFSDVASLNN